MKGIWLGGVLSLLLWAALVYAALYALAMVV